MKRKNAIISAMVLCVLLMELCFAPIAGAAGLKLGDSGDGVKQLQQKLKDKGYYSYGEITGYFGEVTEKALMKYQEKLGLSADGVAGRVTLRALLGSDKAEAILKETKSSSSSSSSSKKNESSEKDDSRSDKEYQAESLYVGVENSEVEDLQDRLKKLGYMSSSQKSTGFYGEITETAVEKFQAGHDLSTDGVAGKKTKSVLFSDSAKKYSKVKEKVADKLSGDKSSSSRSDIASQVCEYAQEFLGTPYVYAANGPKAFDCSGFVIYVMKKFGYTGLSRTAQGMGYSIKNRIDRSDLKKGDLVFFNTIRDNDLSDHAGIYLGNGKFIHASSGKRKVVITDIDSNYWTKAFSWGGRLI